MVVQGVARVGIQTVVKKFLSSYINSNQMWLAQVAIYSKPNVVHSSSSSNSVSNNYLCGEANAVSNGVISISNSCGYTLNLYNSRFIMPINLINYFMNIINLLWPSNYDRNKMVLGREGKEHRIFHSYSSNKVISYLATSRSPLNFN
ncbi:hypothetical protein DICPUDRAFT_85476 [Dictyostelium purpureum]|uniref:Uncharacterized protein n=1 Tax=Dictyostelium purpureum TaxID=5786 RepID=F1A5U5_DICPU|nr:uncharacterized protein DICPUDRAFT_85476 [Dictyostelium purpureum]EGC28435.1 hypothetical protein DICPUDRAFT_85476 [Dictyostelium purpureum]|eukprot:XP_003295040.1 hypothetical protein DICPUDRAFT_85476 [Dictyostelium purpureum]